MTALDRLNAIYRYFNAKRNDEKYPTVVRSAYADCAQKVYAEIQALEKTQ